MILTVAHDFSEGLKDLANQHLIEMAITERAQTVGAALLSNREVTTAEVFRMNDKVRVEFTTRVEEVRS